MENVTSPPGMRSCFSTLRLDRTSTPRTPAAAAHAYTLPTVREIPPVQRPGTYDSTW